MDIRRSLRKIERRHYTDEGMGEDEIDGKRCYDLTEKLADPKFELETYIRELKGEDFTVKYIQENGFEYPLIFKDKSGLGLRVPSQNFNVDDVRRLVGSHRLLDVMDVETQKDLVMTMKDWCKYFKNPVKHKLLNVISLEFSKTKLEDYVEMPKVVKDIDWVNSVWPVHLLEAQNVATNNLSEMKYPKVRKYVLMSVAGCYTDFHIDFGGTSVWYHILHGAKIFWLIPPTERNHKLYVNWTLSANQGEIFFGDLVDNCSRVYLSAGDTFMLPTGWIHAVFTPKESLVFGGNFLHSFSIAQQLKISEIEDLTHVKLKFRYPFYTEIHWFVLEKYIRVLTGKPYINIPKKNLDKDTIFENQHDISYDPDRKMFSLTKWELNSLRALLNYLITRPNGKQYIPTLILEPEKLLQEAKNQLAIHFNDNPIAANTGKHILSRPENYLKNYSYFSDSGLDEEDFGPISNRAFLSYNDDKLLKSSNAVLKSATAGRGKGRKSNNKNPSFGSNPHLIFLTTDPFSFDFSSSAGTISNTSKEDLYKSIMRKRRIRCQQCEACIREDCTECVFCRGMTKFGGPGTLKKPCISRNCMMPLLPRTAACYICGHRDAPDGKLDDQFNPFNINECVYCRMITHPICCQTQFRDQKLAYIAKKGDEKMTKKEGEIWYGGVDQERVKENERMDSMNKIEMITESLISPNPQPENTIIPTTNNIENLLNNGEIMDFDEVSIDILGNLSGTDTGNKNLEESNLLFENNEIKEPEDINFLELGIVNEDNACWWECPKCLTILSKGSAREVSSILESLPKRLQMLSTAYQILPCFKNRPSNQTDEMCSVKLNIMNDDMSITFNESTRDSLLTTYTGDDQNSYEFIPTLNMNSQISIDSVASNVAETFVRLPNMTSNLDNHLIKPNDLNNHIADTNLGHNIGNLPVKKKRGRKSKHNKEGEMLAPNLLLKTFDKHNRLSSFPLISNNDIDLYPAPNTNSSYDLENLTPSCLSSSSSNDDKSGGSKRYGIKKARHDMLHNVEYECVDESRDTKIVIRKKHRPGPPTCSFENNLKLTDSFNNNINNIELAQVDPCLYRHLDQLLRHYSFHLHGKVQSQVKIEDGIGYRQLENNEKNLMEQVRQLEEAVSIVIKQEKEKVTIRDKDTIISKAFIDSTFLESIVDNPLSLVQTMSSVYDNFFLPTTTPISNNDNKETNLLQIIHSPITHSDLSSFISSPSSPDHLPDNDHLFEDMSSINRHRVISDQVISRSKPRNFPMCIKNNNKGITNGIKDDSFIDIVNDGAIAYHNGNVSIGNVVNSQSHSYAINKEPATNVIATQSRNFAINVAKRSHICDPSYNIGSRTKYILEKAIWIKVFSCLQPIDLTKCISCCKAWNIWGLDPLFWKHIRNDINANFKINFDLLKGLIKKRPESLTFENLHLKPSNIEFLLKWLPDLTSLHLVRCTCSAYEIGNIFAKGYTWNMNSLQLSYIEDLDDHSLWKILTFPKDGCDIDKCIVNCDNYNLNDEDIEKYDASHSHSGLKLSIMPNITLYALRDINLTGTHISDVTLKLIGQSWILPHLIRIDFSYCLKITNVGVLNLILMGHNSSLSFNTKKLTPLAKQLVTLKLRGNYNITDNAFLIQDNGNIVSIYHFCPNLLNVDVKNCPKISLKGRQILHKMDNV
ncbi:unnamed protein product [Gordionus sp. m RMFG-2023]|uniref:uncharacterized protein LOC135930500 n=1 Tax=Gordionus sp. m RMFG-2023 TaxID=3053472 RepID=UPI0030E52CD3